MKVLALPPKGGNREIMLSRILDFLKEHPSDPLPDPDARLALGALMVRVIKSDNHYDAEKSVRIDAILARMNGLGPVDAAKMRTTCEKIEAEAPSTRKFALLIRETVSYEARIEALEALWRVILADGKPSAPEMAVVTRVREALGLSKADCDAAQERAAPL
ncbi:TerB family tellurite resistance protein [Roseovarius sp. M141]|uniref:tellurite resistance TerB family protein n=1 Tax=Roseovarius sp. M141 TaxID=2583806 RepID=UPI0020CDFE88|nr:TerB family tellurite resistance protein [Roseovarius sp. M141]